LEICQDKLWPKNGGQIFINPPSLNPFAPAGTQALVRPGSPHSSISAEDRTSMASCICKAKALVDSLPNPYDKEALKFKVSLYYMEYLMRYRNFYLENY